VTELPGEVQELVEKRKLDELEDLWIRRAGETPEDHAFFFALAAAVKKKGSGAKALSWLRLLADQQDAAGPGRLAVLREVARMSPTDSAVRGELEAALRARHASHPVLAAVLARNPLAGSKDPAETADRADRWLRFQVGEVYLMAGRGPGRLVEMNPALDVMRLDVGGTLVPLSLLTAEKNLTVLPAGHFLRRKVEELQGLRALAGEDPVGTLRALLESVGGALPLAQVKEHFAGIVEEARWTSFWAAARRDPRVLVAGGGKNAAVSWTGSADEAAGSVRTAFAAATPEKKIEIARKEAKRSKELARFFAEGLAEEARRRRADSPASAWELSQAAARILPGEPEAFPASELFVGRDPLAVLASIRDSQARERALAALRESRADWPALFAEQFQKDEDSRILASLWEALEPARREELSRRILRSPRLAPRAFLWLAERLTAETAPPGFFLALVDALRSSEMSGVRARLKELFEPGALAVSLVRAAASEDAAREMLGALDRVGSLEEHRRATVREALLMKFPELRAPAREWLYATAEAIAARRSELDKLKRVELPANAEAMRTAKEHGDLRENFEYHAARQKHEYLSARIADLADELSRTRALDPARIDASEVRVGTRVTVRGPAGPRDITILGPWDSRPEEQIYSYQSEFGQRLLGAQPGDKVALEDGAEGEIVAIAPWKTG
jgi:transcription elongation GreA/GreB family factor